MAQAEPLVPVAELVERLESLEGRVKKGGAGAPVATAAPVRSARPATAPTTPIRPAVQTAGTGGPPTPAPTKTPAPAPVRAPEAYRAPADPMAEWTSLLARIETRSKMLAGVYHTARLIAWSDKGIELGIPGGMAADAENLKELKKIITELVGAPLDVKVKTEAAASEGRSLLEVEAEK